MKPAPTGNALHARLVEASLQSGFVLAGGVDLAQAQSAIESHIARYDAWIAAGNAGEMEYLKRGRDRRADPTLVFPDTKSVFCVALPYTTSAQGKPEGARYSRYLNQRDYHLEIHERLESALKSTQRERTSLKWKICVDTSAVLERAWAFLSGLGWIGKNTMLLHPRWGSSIFLGVALLNQELERAPAPHPDFCGRCTRCLDACPTRALIRSPGTGATTLDARQCISYWTLEKKTKWSVEDLAQIGASGRWVAGCDLCTDVCPFDQKIAKNKACTGDASPPALLGHWESLLRESPGEYRERTRGHALSHVKPAQFDRNLAVAIHALIQEPGVELNELKKLVQSRIQSSHCAPENQAIWQEALRKLE